MKKLFLFFLSVVFVSALFTSCGVTTEEVNSTTFFTKAESTSREEKEVSQTETETSSLTTEKAEKTEKIETFKRPVNTTSSAKKENTTNNKTEQITCTFEISCKSILSNMESLDSAKVSFVPKNGMILREIKVSVDKGSTVFDVLKKVCKENKCTDNCVYCKKDGIQLEYNFTPMYKSYYIEGIHQLYEFDCGDTSGWMYSVNGSFPNKGCNQYTVNDGDKIKFIFSCNMGEDVGADF